MAKREILIHYSHAPVTEVRSIPLSDQEGKDGMAFKPKGLWVSVKGNNDWKEWCTSEGFGLARLTHPHRVILAPDANILRITNAAEIDTFTEQYALPTHYLSRYEANWKLVAERYDGIIIAPYIWERRMSMVSAWYYSWDCASGCIWKAEAVMKIIPMPVEQPVTNS